VHEGILRLLAGISIAGMSQDEMQIPSIPAMVSSIQPYGSAITGMTGSRMETETR
jgi:hypothetical protein